MQQLISNLISFLIMIAIGYVISSKKFVSDKIVADLSYVVINVCVPFMLFDAVVQPFDSRALTYGVSAAGLTIVIILVAYAIGLVTKKIFKVEKKDAPGWILGCTFSNNGFMGFPVINAIYGKQGLFINSFSNIGFQLILYSLGVYTVAKDRGGKLDLKAIFGNKLMISCFIAIFMYFFRIPIPGIISPLVKMLSNATSPMAMLVIGLKLGEYNLKDVFFDKALYKLTFVRLIISPAATIALFALLPLPAELKPVENVLIIVMGMPIAANCTSLANTYGKDTHLLAKATALSSTLCMFTIPLLYLIIG